HPPLLQHAVLRLPVRHVLRVERAADEAADDRIRRGSRRRDRALSDVAEVWRQRPPDGAAPARGSGLEQARDGPRGRRSARWPGDEAGSRNGGGWLRIKHSAFGHLVIWSLGNFGAA